MKAYAISAAMVILLSFALLGNAALRTTSFIHDEYDFGQVERVAVVAFENYSNEQGTANYVSRVFLTELLASGAFDVVEPGEVTRVVSTLGQTRPSAELTLEQLKKAGQDLGVQAVIFGTVGESAELRGGSGINAHVVSIDVRMVDTETGVTVWSAVVNTGGPGALAKFFGAGSQSRSSAVRKAVRKAIGTLVK